MTRIHKITGICTDFVTNLMNYALKWKNCSTFFWNDLGRDCLAALAPRYAAPVAMLTLSFTMVSSGTV